MARSTGEMMAFMEELALVSDDGIQQIKHSSTGVEECIRLQALGSLITAQAMVVMGIVFLQSAQDGDPQEDPHPGRPG